MKTSCVIAAYNEHDRIGNVLRVVCGHHLIDEVIVVDDGSIDHTKSVAESFPQVKIFVNAKNRGKSFSVMTGIKESKGEFIIVIDADLIGLTQQQITDLITPVFDNKADITISLRKNAPVFWRMIRLDYISGERVFCRSLLSDEYDSLSKIPKFGLEVFMNRKIIKNKLRIKVVHWDTVHSPEKYKKYSLLEGVRREVGMYVDIFKTISLFEAIQQITRMISLKVK